jgi:hypothetical protein
VAAVTGEAQKAAGTASAVHKTRTLALHYVEFYLVSVNQVYIKRLSGEIGLAESGIIRKISVENIVAFPFTRELSNDTTSSQTNLAGLSLECVFNFNFNRHLVGRTSTDGFFIVFFPHKILFRLFV